MAHLGGEALLGVVAGETIVGVAFGALGALLSWHILAALFYFALWEGDTRSFDLAMIVVVGALYPPLVASGILTIRSLTRRRKMATALFITTFITTVILCTPIIAGMPPWGGALAASAGDSASSAWLVHSVYLGLWVPAFIVVPAFAASLGTIACAARGGSAVHRSPPGPRARRTFLPHDQPSTEPEEEEEDEGDDAADRARRRNPLVYELSGRRPAADSATGRPSSLDPLPGAGALMDDTHRGGGGGGGGGGSGGGLADRESTSPGSSRRHFTTVPNWGDESRRDGGGGAAPVSSGESMFTPFRSEARAEPWMTAAFPVGEFVGTRGPEGAEGAGDAGEPLSSSAAAVASATAAASASASSSSGAGSLRRTSFTPTPSPGTTSNTDGSRSAGLSGTGGGRGHPV